MPFIKNTIPWTSQPQEPVEVDWTNPLTKGLVSGHVGGLWDMVLQEPSGLVMAGGSTFGRSSRGFAPTYKTALDTSDLTIITAVNLTSNNADYSSVEYGYYVSGVDNINRGIGLLNTDNLYVINRRNSSAYSSVKAITFPYAAVLGYSGIGGASCTWYENGVNNGTVVWSGDSWQADTRSRVNTFATTSTGKGASFRFQWNRVLTDAEHARIAQNPWQIFAPQTRNVWVPVASGGVTGTLAVTESGVDTVSVSGDVFVKGTIAASESTADTTSATGNVFVKGTFSTSESGSDTTAIAGNVAVKGTIAPTESATDTAATSGKVIVTGSLAVSEVGSDTAAASGAVTVKGLLAATELSDSIVFSGNVFVEGSAAATESTNDTFLAHAGSVSTGSMAAVETGVDTVASSGNVFVKGSISSTEIGSDVTSISGNVTVKGLLAASELSDSIVFTGKVFINGSLATVESGSDTAAIFSGEFTPSTARLYSVAAEDRLYTVAAEDRIYLLGV